ncbi:GerAB/ArcD/ProY family transporter [Paenibacillus piri]|uniref:Uncharacterized protein n=1 Tax=Paenibacillus piri TaxID=2547395 RepID=A0A4R5KX78_9BACL|nr:GerAB/ArcD/ProY family transporter [Paenibacillus piri]TDG00183.1 hypothetical protein E1757_00610 [Paenibacillus piri]
MMQRISQLQLGLLIIMFHFSTATGFLMALIFSKAEYDGWLVILFSAAGGLLITYVSVALGRQRENEFIVHYGKELLGRWLHIVMMVGTSFFFIHLASIVLRQLTDFLVQIYLPTTPSWMIATLMGFSAAIAVRSGLETIFRCASGFFFIVFGVIAIAPMLVGNELNGDRAAALWTHLYDWKFLASSYTFIPWFGEMFLVLFIFPNIANSQKTYRSILWSTLFTVVFIEMVFVLCLLLFGAHLSAQMSYPILEVVRFIRIGDFLENLDPFLVAVWTASILVKISILLYISILIPIQLLGLKDTRPFTFTFGAIMIGLSMHMVGNMIELGKFVIKSWPNFAMLVECLPVIYWIIALIKKRRSNA